jgi:class 3 adenylate cyclase
MTDHIDDLLRKRKELLDGIDNEIRAHFTRAVTLLFTDIVGSTQYFEQMGDIAGRAMIQAHNDLLFPIITDYNGNVIKTIGDSIMASFEDPLRAVECAVAMQRALDAYNRAKPEQYRIRVRMGLHSGEAVVEKADLFGDMVNTSARVEAKAQANEIIISASLWTQVAHSGIPVVFLGTDQVKGKKERIDFYLVNWNGRAEDEILDSWKSRIGNALNRDVKASRAKRAVIHGNISLKESALRPAESAGHGNPYLNRVMLPQPAMFYGRKALIKRIMGRIGAARPQSVSIVGERRIGKSSLLNYLNFPSTRLALMEQAESFIFLFIDFQQLRATDSGQIIGLIFSELSKTLSDRIELDLPASFDGMRLLADAVQDAGYKFILFFDEFESVTKNEKIKPDFYSFFRSLANNYPLAFVTASGRNLKDMCVTHEISDSPFFNIFSVQNVGLFREDESRELVTGPSATAGVPLEPVQDQIMSEGGCYPFFLQMMCASWFDFLSNEGRKADEFAGKKSPREVLDMFREEAEPHFEYVAETFTAEERTVMKNVVAEKMVDRETPAVEQLAKRGYLIERGDGTAAPFSLEFARFLKKHFAR